LLLIYISDKLLYSYISLNIYYKIMEFHNTFVQSVCHVLHSLVSAFTSSIQIQFRMFITFDSFYLSS